MGYFWPHHFLRKQYDLRMRTNAPQASRYAGYVYILVAFLCLTPWVTPPVALFAGLVFAFFLGSPFPAFNRRASRYLLQVSVVGLGFGMNLSESLRAGADGIVFTIFSVVGVMAVGILIGRLFRVDRQTAYLISSGTAICGGSAIAATGPIAKANEAQMSVSLATIFVLNAVALFLFPPLGHLLGLTQQQFGTWAAIAIHDTSSVVGAGAAYGDEALRIATTVKLTRALWIIPLSLYTAFHFHARNYNPPIKKYKVSNQKVQKRGVFFAPRFLYPFHTSKGGIFTPFDCLLYFLEGRRVDQIEHDDLIAACLHCGTAAAEGGNRIAQRLTLEGIV